MPTDDVFAAVAALPGVEEEVDRARAAVDGLRRHRVLRRSTERVAAESVVRGGRASSALEGVAVGLDEVRRAAAEGASEVGNPVVRGALRVAAATASLQRTWGGAPLQVLARLHVLAASDLVDATTTLGRPAPAAVPRLQALGAALASSSGAPALVVAAVVHGEVVISGAFPTGGGVVARAAARLCMLDRGLDPAAVSVPEVGHVDLGVAAYASALGGYADGGAAGVAAWVGHCAEAVVLGAREGVAVCEAIQRGA